MPTGGYSAASAVVFGRHSVLGASSLKRRPGILQGTGRPPYNNRVSCIRHGWCPGGETLACRERDLICRGNSRGAVSVPVFLNRAAVGMG